MGISYAKQHRTFFYNFKRYGIKISNEELKQIIITIVVVAFVWSFNKWGDETFDFVMGIQNFMKGILFATIGLIMNQIGQRIVAVYYGYDPIYEYSMIGIMAAVVIAFSSRGYLIFFLPGGIKLRHLAASRLGEFRYYTSDWEWAKAAFQGPFFNIVLALILSMFKHIPVARQLMVMNIMFAIYSIVPLPGNVGLYLFYPLIFFWAFTVGFVLSTSLLIFFLSPFFTLLIGTIVAVASMAYWYIGVDKKLDTEFDKAEH